MNWMAGLQIYSKFGSFFLADFALRLDLLSGILAPHPEVKISPFLFNI